MTIEIPDIYKDLLTKKARYKIYHGGRGSGKSWSFARALIIKALSENIRVLCVRQIQRSIKDSVYKLLMDQVKKLNLENSFYFKIDSIICLKTGSEFLFKGLYGNPHEIKSLEGIDICWLEEGQLASRESLEILDPTIRKKDSEIWISLNLDSVDDAVYKLFIENPIKKETLSDQLKEYFSKSNYDEISIIKKANYNHNPKFPEILKMQMEHDKKTNYDKYLHVWEGMPRAHTEAQIFKNKFTVENFKTKENVIFYHGADWGFSNDPTVIIRCYIIDNTLYIDREVWGIGIEIDDIPGKFREIETVKRGWNIYADSSRPETISYLQRAGLNIQSCKKWKGSVEDGIEFMKSFDKIIIHENLYKTIEEFKYYSYNIDSRTGKILNTIKDEYNHCIDAIRYALQDVITVTNEPVFTRGI